MKQQYHLPRLNMNHFYQNPLYYENNDTLPTNPDPYVIKYNGHYYCYSTGENGVNVSVSDDLVSWTYLGFAVQEADKHDYWAPCVIYDNGIFYMYCSNTSVDTKDNHQEFLQLYTSVLPEGPFEYRKTFFQKFSIDAHVVKDFDGELYLFYSVNDYLGTDELHSGTVILMDRLINYMELEGNPKPIVLPSIEEEIFEKNRFGDGRDWYTIEGAFFLRHHQKSFLLYSANAYVRENYFMGYSYGQNNSKLPDLRWNKYPCEETFSPFIRKNEAVEGTGHCSVIQAPNLIDSWIVYHGRNQNIPLSLETEQRVMRMDPLFFSGDRLITNAPSYEKQDAPEPPIYCCFDDLKEPDFTIVEEKGIIRKTLNITFDNYIMEWDISCKLTHMGARYGILLSYQDAGNYVELLIDSGKQCVFLNREENFLLQTLAVYQLPKHYKHDVSHQVRVLRTYDYFHIYLDDISIIESNLSIPFGQVGLVTKYSEAQVHFFAINPYLALYGNHLFYFSKLFCSDKTAHFNNNRISCASASETTFKEIVATMDCEKILECSFRNDTATLRLHVMEENQSIISLWIHDGVIEVETFADGIKIDTDIWSHKETDFAINIKQKGSKTMLRIDNNWLFVETPKEKKDNMQRIEFSACCMDIVGYEMYSLTYF